MKPSSQTEEDGITGKQSMTIEDREIPLIFDGRKTFLNIRRPSSDKMNHLEVLEMTSPLPFEPENSESRNRRDFKRKYNQFPGGLTLQQWQNRLGIVPEDVVRKNFDAITQLVMNVEAENRTIGRNHYKSRFPFLRENRLNDIFHTDTFFLSVDTHDGNT